MEFRKFRLEAVIKNSSNRRQNERWRKENPRDQLQPVTVQGREFGLLVNPNEPERARDIRISLALGGGMKRRAKKSSANSSAKVGNQRRASYQQAEILADTKKDWYRLETCAIGLEGLAGRAEKKYSSNFYSEEDGEMKGTTNKLPLVAWGTEVGAGFYRCMDCGQIYMHDSIRRLPTCPQFLNQSHPKSFGK